MMSPRNSKRLRGKWKAVALEANGMKLPKEAVPDFTFTVAADGKSKGKMPKGEYESTMSVDPKKVPQDHRQRAHDRPAQGQNAIRNLQARRGQVDRLHDRPRRRRERSAQELRHERNSLRRVHLRAGEGREERLAVFRFEVRKLGEPAPHRSSRLAPAASNNCGPPGGEDGRPSCRLPRLRTGPRTFPCRSTGPGTETTPRKPAGRPRIRQGQ